MSKVFKWLKTAKNGRRRQRVRDDDFCFDQFLTIFWPLFLGWVKMVWTGEIWLMSSEENSRLWQMWISPEWKCRWLDLENTKLFLGEIQRCSKRRVDITCLQMQIAGFDKCKAVKPANPDIRSEQIQTDDFDKSTRARHTDVIFVIWHIHSHPNKPLNIRRRD